MGVCAVCLDIFGWQLVLEILEHLLHVKNPTLTIFKETKSATMNIFGIFLFCF